MGYITLLSDLGLRDASVAIAKGILMQHVPASTILDVTHEIQPFHIAQAAYMLGTSYRNFPSGTSHIPLFDIFSDKQPKLVLCEADGHYFLVPDNGLLPMALGKTAMQGHVCFTLEKNHSFHNWIAEAGKVAAQLVSTPPAQLQMPTITLKALPDAREVKGAISCDVVHIDEYENVVINFTREQYKQLSQNGTFTLNFMRTEEIRDISENYNDVREGYKLCRFNDNGYLEICINHGRAASLFGFRLGGKNNDIKITFQ